MSLTSLLFVQLAAVAQGSGSTTQALTGRIVYSCGQGGASICTMSPQGNDPGTVVRCGDPNLGAGCTHPTLSPDGDKLAYIVGKGATLRIAGSDGSNPEAPPALHGGGSMDPTWSPQGDRLAFFSADGRIETVKPDGSDLQTVFKPLDAYAPGGLAWSPDGSEIAFAEAPADCCGDGSIIIVPASGGSTHPIDTGPGTPTGLTWAPAKSLLFEAGALHESGGAATSVDEVNPDGTGLRQVLPTGAGISERLSSPSWGPDGLHFSAVDNGKVVIATVANGVESDLPPVGVTYAQWGGAPLAAHPTSGGCQPSRVLGAEATAGSDLASNFVNTAGVNDADTDTRQRHALSTLRADASDTDFVVGFFNTITPERLLAWLQFDRYEQPVDPLVFDTPSDWFIELFEKAAETCGLTHDAAYSFLHAVSYGVSGGLGNNPRQPLLRYLSQNPQASRGLLVKLSQNEILTLWGLRTAEKPQYTLLDASALAADDEITSLTGDQALPVGGPSAHFQQDQAQALAYIATLTIDGFQILESAVLKYATSHLPPPPKPQRQAGSLDAVTEYDHLADYLAELQFALSAPIAAERARGITAALVDEKKWEETVSSQSGGGGDDLGMTGAAGELIRGGELDMSGLLAALTATWFTQHPDAQAQAAPAALWLCHQEQVAEASLFLPMLESKRLLYGWRGRQPQTLVSPLQLPAIPDGADLYDGRQFPPRTEKHTLNDIETVLRPPTPSGALPPDFRTLVADSAGGDTGVAARVPFDVIAWDWRQQLDSQQIDACTVSLAAVAGAPAPPWVGVPRSGIGSAIVATGDGYAPDSSVQLSGHSSPVPLTTARTNADGEFAAFIDPAHELGAGQHELVATGRDPTGAVRILKRDILVSDAPAIRQTAAPADDTTFPVWVWLTIASLAVICGLTLARPSVRAFLRRGGRRQRAK